MTTANTLPTLPQASPKWDFTPEAIAGTVSASIATTTALLDKLGSLPAADCTFDSVARALALREGMEAQELERAIFLQYVSTDEQVRDAAVEGDKKFQQFSLTAVSRTDVYQALLSAQKNSTKLGPEDQRLLDRMLLERKRNGLALSPEDRAKLLERKQKIAALAVGFQRNCNAESGFLLFTPEELAGVQDLSGYPEVTVDGQRKLKVTYKSPDIVPLFKFASVPATRKLAFLGYEGKTAENAPLLAEIITLRREVAALLGYANYADYELEPRMAKDSKTVFDFLHGLQKDLTPIATKEKVALLALKKEECAQLGIPFVNELYVWEYRYYDRLYVEKTLAVDEEAIKEYFPVENVINKVLEVYQELLGFRVHPVPRTEGGATWHEDATMHAVFDAQDDSFLGYLHLDLFPRAGKYGHAAVWGLEPGMEMENGGRHFPVVAMVANLAKATASRPALMSHSDCVTFFHELGHAWHGLLSRTSYARFHGTSVARDFVEAPSQMLENWCWEPTILKRITQHYVTKESLSDDTIKNLIASKSVNQGLFNLRQLFHGLYDMTVHTAKEDTDLTKLWNDSRAEISLVSSDGENVAGQSGFAHIVSGYSAGYYGYLYAQVFAADMYEKCFSGSPMDPALGAHYRKEILKVGGSRDEEESLRKFLGRDPSNVAFLKSLLGSK